MLKTDNTWKSGIISNGRSFTYRLLANGADIISPTAVTSCVITECGASEHKLKVGEFCKSSIELSVLTSAYNKWSNGYLQIYISCNGSAEVSLGKFWIYKSELKDDGRYTKLTGYDVPEYMTEKADPVSTDVAAIVSAIEADSGMKVINKSVFTLKSITAFPEGTTNMQLLGYIAGYSGYNLRTDRNGNIEAYRYQDTDDILLVPKEDLYPSEDLFPDTPVITSSDAINGFVIPRRNTFSGSQSYAADPIYVNSIIVTNGTESYTVGAGSSITYENPFITSADQIDQSYIGTSYVPLNNSWRGNPAVQIGDVLMVETAENEFQRVLVMEQKLTLDGGFSATLCCYGETDAAIASAESPTMREIKAAKKTITDALLEALTTILGAGAGYFNFVDKDGNVITSASKDAVIAGWQITDSPTVTDSTKGWRFLLGGLYYSSNGFKTARNFALTDEGQIVANSITTGRLQDAAGDNYWDLDTGEFSLKALTNYSTTEEMSAAIKASADGISSTVSKLSTKVDSNTTAINDNAKAISDTSAGLSSANTKITENSSAITQNAKQISSVVASVETVSSKTDSNTKAIEANSAAISSANTKISENSSAITQNANSIKSVVSSVEKVSSSVDSANDAISRNAEAISTNTSKIEQNAKQISSTVSSVNTLSDKVSANTKNISANADAIAANSSSITQTAANIMSTVSATYAGKGEIISVINQSAESIKISADKVAIETSDFTFGKAPSTVTMKTNSGSTGVSFEGSGTVDFNTKGSYKAVNVNANSGENGSLFNMYNSGSNNSLIIQNYKESRLGNQIELRSNDSTFGTYLRMTNYNYANSKMANTILWYSNTKKFNAFYLENYKADGTGIANQIFIASDFTKNKNTLTLKNFQFSNSSVVNGMIEINDNVTIKAQNWLSFYACGGDRRVVFKGLQKFEVNGVDILAKLNIAAQGAQTM